MRLIDKYKTYPYASIHNNVISQQYGIVNNWELYNVTRSSKNFIQRLKKWCTLEGHTGCVNTVSWNSSGTLLLSGSDDYLINIYDIYSEKMLHSIESGHRANIFSAKFLPCTSDMKIVSCSGDGMLHYNELGSNYGENFFNCHSGTTYEVLVTPGDPNTFLSCGEDGTVRLFDLRTKTKCHCQECSEDILIDTRHAVTSVSINPLSPFHLAAGCKDSYVRVFDRRTLGTSVNTRSVNRNRGWMPGLFCKFKPEKLRKDASCRITSLRYSNDGSSILVSYCTDYVYTFTVNDDQGKYMSTKETKTDNGYHTNGTKNSLDYESEGLPPVKRLRLRGDWSDTGPQARPETAEESVPENNLMQRMSELFSRWLEDAISSPLERQTSYGSNTSLDNETVGANSQQDNTSQNDEDNVNTLTNDVDQDGAIAVVTSSDEPNSNNCPLEASMDSVDVNWMLCSTDDETNDTVNNDDTNNNKNNSNENIVEKYNDEGNHSNDSNDSNHRHGNTVNENTGDVNSTSVCERSVSCENTDIEATSSTRLNNINETSKPLGTNATSCFSANTSFLDECSSIDIVEESCVDNGDSLIESDRFLNERTLWPDNFNTGYSSDDDSTNETNTKVRSSSVRGEDSSISRLMELTPQQSAYQNKTRTNHDCSLSRNENDTFDNIHHCSNEFEDNPINKVEDESTVNINNNDDNNDDNYNNENIIYSSNDDQRLIGNAMEEQSDQINWECSDFIKTHDDDGSLRREATDNTSVDGNSSENDCLDRSRNNKNIDTINETEIESEVGSTKPDDTSAISYPSCSTVVGDGTDSDDAQTVENMQVVSLDTDVDIDSDVNALSSTPRRNELLYRVMQHTSRDAESHSTEDLSGDTDRLSNDLEESSNQMDTNVRDSVLDGTDETQGSIDNSIMRERAATRIQKFLRLNKSKFNSSDEYYEQNLNPVYIPTKYSVFKGHRNARTMIKEANFWGDDYVLSGSDCGRIFIWDRHTGDLVMLLQGDSHVVNCVQPHPFDPILASSGIDHDVKIWAPLAEELPDLTDMGEIVNRNEQMLEESRDTITVPASFVLRMLASFGSRRRRRTSYRRIDDDAEDTES